MATCGLVAVCVWMCVIVLWLGLGPCAHVAWAEGENVPTEAGAECEGEKGPTEGDPERADLQSAEQAPHITPAVEKKIRVSVRFVGDDGEWASVKRMSLTEDSSAWDATRTALTQAGLAYRTGTESTQDVIVSLTSEGGTTLSSDFSLGSSWRLHLNGERCQGSSSTVVLSEGDVVEWRYEVGAIMVTVAVVGPGGTGDSYWIPPTSVRMNASKSVWDASLTVFSNNGYEGKNLISYTTGPSGEVWLDSLSALGENGITGELWQLFVNGVLSSVDAAHIALRAGDSICWYYSGRGVSELPSFATQTGAGTQNPATAVRIEGIVIQSWESPVRTGMGAYATISRRAGLCVAGSDTATALVWEGNGLMNPLSQTLANNRWRQSLASVMAGRLSTGEGIRSITGADGRIYYLSDQGSLVSLGVR